MNQITLTVFFDDPFWVAILERQNDQELMVARQVFGAEPSNAEVYRFALRPWEGLRFTRPLVAERVRLRRSLNPKRRQREARREMMKPRLSTKAQQALQQEWEASKQVRHEISRQARADQKERKYELRRLKQKQKHAGR